MRLPPLPRLSLLLLLLAACGPPELEWSSTVQRIPTASGISVTARAMLEGDRVRADLRAPFASGVSPIEDRWGTLTPEGRRRLDDALDVLARDWSPPYIEAIGVGHAFWHAVDVDGDGSEDVIHELDLETYTAEVRPLSGVVGAITDQMLRCGADLVVLDSPPQDCPP
jgi:hypothetical protein